MEQELVLDVEIHKELLEYYSALESILDDLRDIGEHRTHFGFLAEYPTEDYCYFKNITQPKKYTIELSAMKKAMDNLHVALFKGLSSEVRSVLDVGCGTGGTMKKLAECWVEKKIMGININEVQIKIARKHCSHLKNTTIIHDDFLTHSFNQKFDLIYFIESAFHISDKDLLFKRVSDLLSDMGEVYIVDIFYPEKLSKCMGAQANSIFDYLTLSTWKKKLSNYGIELVSYVDNSASVARYIKTCNPFSFFLNGIINDKLKNNPHREVFEQRFIEIYEGYSKLHRYFNRQLLEYAIVKFKRV
ncbi:MAG: class I SAM-dependent methyltransferase [Bacteroidales bacterium]|nr:MAG: class I SAM-dependent methyltransferase [Bacteroidales bacterium]